LSLQNSIKIFAGSSGKGFASKMADFLGISLSSSQTITFSEGNTYVKACETVRGFDVYIIQPIGVRPNDDFVELLFWIDAFKRASAQSVTAIIPYFSYAKADKKDEPHVSIRARVCADCMEIAGVDRVVTMDLHSPQVQGFFRKPVDNLYGLPVLCEYVKTLNISDMVVVSPDAGFAKTARKYAEHLGADLVIGEKIRRNHQEEAEILNLIGDVAGKNALIVDDFSLSGGTLIRLAEALKKRDAKQIFACITHTLFSEKAVAALEKSPIDMLIGMDTIDNPRIGACNKVKIISAAPLFAEAVIRIQNRESLSALFDHVMDNVIRHSW
jgi:ribose-phosphate pyrophosphokinase